jgi:hypothetical protein
MPQSQHRLSSAIPFVAIERPAFAQKYGVISLSR